LIPVSSGTPMPKIKFPEGPELKTKNDFTMPKRSPK